MKFVCLLLAVSGCVTTPKIPTHRTSKELSPPSCQKTIVIDAVAEPWLAKDDAAFHRASRRCQSLYPRSPCLYRFDRVAPGTYHARCGAALPKGVTQ